MKENLTDTSDSSEHNTERLLQLMTNTINPHTNEPTPCTKPIATIFYPIRRRLPFHRQINHQSNEFRRLDNRVSLFHISDIVAKVAAKMSSPTMWATQVRFTHVPLHIYFFTISILNFPPWKRIVSPRIERPKRRVHNSVTDPRTGGCFLSVVR